MHYIEVKNVSQIYSVGNEPVNALTNISFAIEKGEFIAVRSEERRVGKECRSRWSPYH